MHLTGWQQSTVPRPLPYSRPCSSEVSELKMMFSEDTPSSFRKPTQNWCVDQMLRTFGMPTRSLERSFTCFPWSVASEAFFANHVCNIRIGTLYPLDFGFDHFHLI